MDFGVSTILASIQEKNHKYICSHHHHFFLSPIIRLYHAACRKEKTKAIGARKNMCIMYNQQHHIMMLSYKTVIKIVWESVRGKKSILFSITVGNTTTQKQTLLPILLFS